MNKFFDLPLIQRILIVAIALAVVTGGGFYLLILPTTQAISREQIKLKNTMNEYSKLREYDAPEFKQEMDRQKAEAVKQREAYAKMLPREDELPDLIDALKREADNSGLALTRFEPNKEGEVGDGYRGLAFDVEMIGSYHQIVTFMNNLAAPSKRIINAKNLNIQLVPSDQLQKSAGDVGMLRVIMERETARGLTPTEKYAKAVLLFDDIAKRRLLKVTFTAMAYVYTGERAPTAP
ncbi:MAG TPA: type 4a pilus biogenesis protein PilO [Myxococcota bacterium]|nr:type 4a pilus biogenesis protein PilO [Myxococcota bacterium]HPV04825.1 type 4a pilus biogenesis protein PilO [Myxococcota bacterium]